MGCDYHIFKQSQPLRSGNTSQRTDYSFIDERSQPGQTYSYRLSAVNTNGKIHIYDVIEIILPDAPKEIALEPPYPNPFYPETRIRYFLAETEPVEIAVYDLLGRKVKTLNR